jgi:hypothetical protein
LLKAIADQLKYEKQRQPVAGFVQTR